MAAYFMGCRSGTAKKSGNWYGCLYLLHLNQYKQWSIDAFWFDDKNTFDILMDGLRIGSPVNLNLNTELKVVDLAVLDDVPALPLSASAD